MTEPRVWVAPLGTSLDGPGWTDIGHLHGGGLVYEQEPCPLPPLSLGPISATFTMKVRFSWGSYRWLFDRTCPRASRVKRAYHQRRR